MRNTKKFYICMITYALLSSNCYASDEDLSEKKGPKEAPAMAPVVSPCDGFFAKMGEIAALYGHVIGPAGEVGAGVTERLGEWSGVRLDANMVEKETKETKRKLEESSPRNKKRRSDYS